LSRVIRAQKPRLRAGSHVNAAVAKTSRDTAGNVFVQVKPNLHPSGCFAMILTLRIDLRKVIPARFIYKGALLPNLCLDLLDVIDTKRGRRVLRRA
jgi:hypothetical protein